MESLSHNDLNFVLMRCPKDIVKLLKDNAGKLFLAGGFIRATIAGEKPADIDLFGTTKEDLLRIAKDLTLERKGRFFETQNAITVLAPPRFPVQFITRWVFGVPGTLISSFDFTVCQAVIWAERSLIPTTPEITPEPGKAIEAKEVYKFHSLCSDSFYPDLAARRLVYTHPVRNEEAGGSLMRVIKFVKKGYTVQAPTIAGVVARLTMSAEFKERSDERWRTQVLTGLLREVDPLTIIDGVDFVDEHEVIQP
jgi:hypothetical protein